MITYCITHCIICGHPFRERPESKDAREKLHDPAVCSNSCKLEANKKQYPMTK